MNKKTILILLVLAIAVLGFTMGPACAATTTIKMGKYKDVGSKDRILTFYQPKDAQNVKGVEYMLLSFTMIKKEGMTLGLTLMS